MAPDVKEIYPCPNCGEELFGIKPKHQTEDPEHASLEDELSAPVREIFTCPDCEWTGTKEEVMNKKVNRELQEQP